MPIKSFAISFLLVIIPVLLMGCSTSPTLHEVRVFCEGNVKKTKLIDKDRTVQVECK